MISTTEIYNVLLFEFPYFKKINEEKRQLLCKRTQEFAEGTKFIPKKGMDINNRIKILISACSQQLTLGFKKHYAYAYFDKIIVYPEKYLSTHTGKYHTGEMNSMGIIVLSWEDFYKGITNDSDTRNVGLHEFAHALEFMDMCNKDTDEVFSAFLDKFLVLGDHYLKNKPEVALFRSYATTNLSEFFAVATEYYFESPVLFSEKEPTLFTILDNAYQQKKSVNKNRVKYTPISKSTIKVFGSYISFLNYVGEIGLYILTIMLSLWIATESPIVAIVVFVTAFYLMLTYLFKDSFTLYESHVQIHQPLSKKIVKMVLPSKYNYQTVIDYSDVLYVTAQEFDFNTEAYPQRRLFSELKEGYWYTLCYFQNERLRYAKQSSNDLNYEKVFRFLYLTKQVATRLGGSFKKYESRS